MAKAIAKAYNVALIEVLTGFKYIGEQIKFFEQSGAHNYVFGLEESYGCLAGTYARDKDACVAVMMLCEVAAYYKQQGKTLWDAMVDMYEEYGYYKEGLATMTLKGIDGAKEIQTMMTNFRENPPKELGGFQVLAVRDYKADVRQDLVSGEKSATGLPSSNVLYYELENNAWCCVRPSGTEPKIKFYFGVKGTSLEDAAEKLEKLKNERIHQYEAYAEGVLSREKYITVKKQLTETIEKIQSEQKALASVIIEEERYRSRIRTTVQQLEVQIERGKLTKEIIDTMIDTVYVYDKKRIEVILRFDDVLQKVISEYMEGAKGA